MAPVPRLALSAAAALALAVASCGDSPTEPTPGSGLGPFASLAVAAPPGIAPGESVQLGVRAMKPDGSVLSVTSQAQWSVRSVPDSSVLSVTPTGVATGGTRGESVVTARFAGLTAEATIFVLPNGTFRLSGNITAAGVGLGGVAVTVIQGVGEGIAAQTTASGEYALYGVGGALRIRASKQGFLDRVQQIDVSGHEALSFELTPGNSRDGMYSGPYTLIITAGRCSGAFPEAGKRRVYTADVQQAGASLRVSLSGADFWTGSGVFAGEVMPAGDIRFTIRPEWAWDYDAFDWIERLPDGTSLIVQGAIVARGTAAGISGVANHESDAGNALHVRVNAHAGSWCYIDRFELVPH